MLKRATMLKIGALLSTAVLATLFVYYLQRRQLNAFSGSKSIDIPVLVPDPSLFEVVVPENKSREDSPVEWLYRLLYTGMNLVWLALIFRPLELAYPAKEGQAFFRPAWRTDLCFFLGQYLVWNGIVLWIILLVGGYVRSWVPIDFRDAVMAQSWWWQVIEIVAVSDLLIYWGHRLQHRVDILWRFHAVHHGAEHLDWLAAHREHPLDTVFTEGLINLPAFALGFPVESLSAFIAFRGLWAIYIHSNVRLPIGPLRWFIGAPELHHWHHDKARDAGNYANLSPLMDLLFGTYRCPDREPEAFGLREPLPASYWGQLLQPLLPRHRASN